MPLICWNLHKWLPGPPVYQPVAPAGCLAMGFRRALSVPLCGSLMLNTWGIRISPKTDWLEMGTTCSWLQLEFEPSISSLRAKMPSFSLTLWFTHPVSTASVFLQGCDGGTALEALLMSGWMTVFALPLPTNTDISLWNASGQMLWSMGAAYRIYVINSCVSGPPVYFYIIVTIIKHNEIGYILCSLSKRNFMLWNSYKPMELLSLTSVRPVTP